MSRDRPSAHGAALGAALADLAEQGRTDATGTPCQGCAFRRGSYANQSAGTVKEALNCTVGIEGPFGCHHGLVDGQPTRLCAGFVAALNSSHEAKGDALVGALAAMGGYRAEGKADPVREPIDRWLAQVDPEDRLDDYQRSALYARALKAGEIG